LIVAVAANGVIGRDNGLPWHLSADLKRFKRLTMDHHVIVGRKTWESIGRALPGREMMVLSRSPLELPAGVHRSASLEAALSTAEEAGEEEAFVAGGAAIYELALPLANRVYWTEVQAEVDGDIRFPPFDRQRWTQIEREEGTVDERSPLPHAFVVYDRATGG
jgi:dihydrofolate reductase